MSIEDARSAGTERTSAARRANAESRAVYYVLVPVGAVMALGERRRPRLVSLGSEALGIGPC